MFSYASDIQSQCKLLQPEFLKSLNRKIQPEGMLLFRQYPDSFWPQGTNEQDAFVRLATELYAVTYNYGELMVSKTLRGSDPDNFTRLRRINNLRHLFCHGLIVCDDNDSNHFFSSIFFRDAGLRSFPQNSTDWKLALEYLVQYSNKLAEGLDKALDDKLQNNLQSLQEEWVKLWLCNELKKGGKNKEKLQKNNDEHSDDGKFKWIREEVNKQTLEKEVEFNRLNQSIIAQCYRAVTNSGDRPSKTWTELINHFPVDGASCTLDDLADLVIAISNKVYTKGATSVDSPLAVQSSAVRWFFTCRKNSSTHSILNDSSSILNR